MNSAARLIQEGKVVAFPTETVYGLGADALNPLAVARIFELKQRPFFAPLIIHIADRDDMAKLVKKTDERVNALAEKFWPGPLTILLPKSDIVPDIVTAGLSTVGIRMPDNPLALELIRTADRPIAAPSANKFGCISPTTAAHVKKQLPDVDYILDGGRTTVGIESTIIRLTEKGFTVLRNGIITQQEIETLMAFDPTAHTGKVTAPGMLKSHYSPKKALLIAGDATKNIDRAKAGLISFSGRLEKGYKKVIKVAPQKDLKEYAVNLFDAMHRFEDDEDIERIIAEPVEEKGIGKAIMDRLRKAEYNWRKE
jgi:L-threonylcarbamoyladenylate synthase